MTIDEFFEGRASSRQIFDAIRHEISIIGETSIRVSKSQIAFRRKRNVATVWVPGQYLKGDVAPLVLTLSYPKEDPSDRWKEIIRISSRRFTHHLELFRPSDIDDQVKSWLRSTWEAA